MILPWPLGLVAPAVNIVGDRNSVAVSGQETDGMTVINCVARYGYSLGRL